MYLLSTMTMNHRPTMDRWFGEGEPDYQLEKVLDYDRVFADSVTRKQAADQILADLDLSGASWVQGDLEDGPLVIMRAAPLNQRRITYSPKTKALEIERSSFRLPAFLEELHHRRGYGPNFVLDRLWAASVDLVILSIIFWAISGLWIWWEIRKTRAWGAVCLTAGVGLFSIFLLMI